MMTNVIVRCICIGLLQNVSHARISQDKKVSEVWRRLKTATNKHLRPNYTDAPIRVNASLTILQFSSINDKKMTFKTDLFVRQRWHDYRLRHNLSVVLTPHVGHKHPASFIWVPDTVFHDMLKASISKITTNNHKLDIFPDGTVLWGCRVTLQSYCMFDLRKFPLDTQTCIMGFESYALPRKHIKFNWDVNDSLAILSEEQPQHLLTVLPLGEEDGHYELKHGTVEENYFSLVRFSVMFKRRVKGYVMQTFFPCAMVTMVSWISFWLHLNCISARTGLGIVTLLTLCKFWQSVINDLPDLSYSTAIDLYILVCIGFIFISLLELAFVRNINFSKLKKQKASSVREARQRQREVVRHIASNSSLFDKSRIPHALMAMQKRRSPILTVVKSTEPGQVEMVDNTGRRVLVMLSVREEKTQLKRDYSDMWKKENKYNIPYYFKAFPVTGKPSTIDVISRFLFPFAFLCFNFIYWVKYIY